ncbi:MAG: murein biosynthesis integral membrane protein MurJ [Chloroflexota bacterium]|nr:murein biosynthesis integral membrane protein MurJ [Chloroflexota bacterium]
MAEETVISGETKQVTRAAVLISLGNISSRLLGLLREMVKSYFFGAGGVVSAFDVAAQVPTMFYDLLAGGMLSSALVPVFSDYAKSERQEELWHLLSLLLSIVTVSLGGLLLLVEATAPQVARLLGAGLEPEYLQLATRMIYITTPAILFLNVAALFSGVLYALQRFERPAFLGTVSNATLVLIVMLLGRSALGAHSLAIGLLAGSLAQVLFQWHALRGVQLHLVSPFTRHPALGTIAKLYLPIGLGLIVDQLTVALSFNLASRTGASGIAWMKYAATIIQFPLGMVVTAISVAILPTLSRYATESAEESFRATLSKGLRLVLILIVPAAAMMLVLAEPLVGLLFQRGNFMPADTEAVSLVLRLNLLGLVFAALDQPLIFAFYARKDTWTPALVGVAISGLYAALSLIPTLFAPPNLSLLIMANSLKLTGHALLMLYLFAKKVGTLRPHGLAHTIRLAGAAAAVMLLPMVGGRYLVSLMGRAGIEKLLMEIILSGGLGALTYLGLLRRLGVEEIQLLHAVLLRWWHRNKEVA